MLRSWGVEVALRSREQIFGRMWVSRQSGILWLGLGAVLWLARADEIESAEIMHCRSFSPEGGIDGMGME